MSLLLRNFFRIEPVVDPARALEAEGPVIYVGNHPNGLVDPGLLFILVRRHVTFLAKAPLFRMPVLGWLLRGLDALPVFRRQDGDGDTSKNDATLTASVEALVAGRAITLFPEGKSHSEPQLAELKTGCARIALDAFAKGAPVRVVPVGMTYGEKNRFKSLVHVEVGAPLEVAAFATPGGATDVEAVRRLTDAIADALRALTLNLARWEDLPLVTTAEALYALERQDRAGDLERHKAFARGLSLLREEQPARFDALKAEVVAFQRRLALVQVTPEQLAVRYRPSTVARFVVKNLLWLAGLPVFLLGMAAFVVPYWVPLGMVAIAKPEEDTESTVKVLTLLLLAPLWWALLVALAWWLGGAGAGLATLLGVPPLALFTRWYLERRVAAVRDARVFFLFVSRRRLKARLLAEGRALAQAIDAVAAELRERVTG
ncbi:MAG: 1-acyl-sn-glycerol-3-phosphate acyltransferase [Myxococcaceae bacterium]|nr:1-acyl-sn-glycerol-3-phosphate acyltransferase [Myxococcaceae bacterium]MCA3014922.1 1-acyl-sn-glycerol-3-phosphate acyltransferase [Myxococcaceae bacterium]